MTVSLPSAWVKANQLQAGKEVLVAVEQNNVLISTEGQDFQEPTIRIDIRHFSEDLVRLLLSALHKKGYEEVRLTCNQYQLSFSQNRISKNLLGYEIVEGVVEDGRMRESRRVDYTPRQAVSAR